MNPRSYELPTSPFAQALASARAGRITDAIAAIERLLRADRSEPRVTDAARTLAHVARLAEALEDPDGARRALASAVALRPAYPDLLAELARTTLLAPGGQTREARTAARSALDAALRIQPGFVAARLQRAMLDASEGLIGEALESLRSLAAECRIEEPRAFAEAIESLERADWEEAGVLLQRALPPEGADAEAALDRAREATERGDDATATQVLRSALARHAAYPDLYLALGTVEFRRGHLDDALMSFARALELNPDLHAARVEFARALDALGQGVQAREQVALVLDREPDHAGAHGLAERWSARVRRSAGEFTARNHA